jgi:hypothetical protein
LVASTITEDRRKRCRRLPGWAVQSDILVRIVKKNACGCSWSCRKLSTAKPSAKMASCVSSSMWNKVSDRTSGLALATMVTPLTENLALRHRRQSAAFRSLHLTGARDLHRWYPDPGQQFTGPSFLHPPLRPINLIGFASPEAVST